MASPWGRPRDPAADVSWPDDVRASVDGTAVPSQCTGAGIRFPGGITLTAGQILALAARRPPIPIRVVLSSLPVTLD